MSALISSTYPLTNGDEDADYEFYGFDSPLDGQQCSHSEVENIGEYFFEPNPPALKKDEDYQYLMKTLVMLEAQKSQAIKDLEYLVEVKNKALNNPHDFVEAIQKRENLNLPAPINVIKVRNIDFAKKYTAAANNDHVTPSNLAMQEVNSFDDCYEMRGMEDVVPNGCPLTTHSYARSMNSLEKELERSARQFEQNSQHIANINSFDMQTNGSVAGNYPFENGGSCRTSMTPSQTQILPSPQEIDSCNSSTVKRRASPGSHSNDTKKQRVVRSCTRSYTQGTPEALLVGSVVLATPEQEILLNSFLGESCSFCVSPSAWRCNDCPPHQSVWFCDKCISLPLKKGQHDGSHSLQRISDSKPSLASLY